MSGSSRPIGGPGGGSRTNDGLVDLVSAQLDYFTGIPTERWYCGGCHGDKLVR